MEYTQEHNASAVSLLNSSRKSRFSTQIRTMKQQEYSLQFDKKDEYLMGEYMEFALKLQSNKYTPDQH